MKEKIYDVFWEGPFEWNDKNTVKVASVKEFESWEKWKIYERDIYPRFRNRNILKAIEALLIYAHQPAYNTVNKERIIKAKGIRVFNTGKCGLLLPEVSYYYHGE